MIPGVEPEVPLSLSLHKAPGTYAVFLGSGVSRAAEIPTGWEVTLDLVRELAASKGEQAGVDDPEGWYEATFGEGPNYSVLLERLARTRQERRDLLQGYFEPTDEDREEGRKLPTRAHEAVAELVAKGCVHVIVTTNFDRLTERALQDAGVNPQVISSEDDIEGAQPLQHARATVVKANGDYLDAASRTPRRSSPATAPGCGSSWRGSSTSTGSWSPAGAPGATPRSWKRCGGRGTGGTRSTGPPGARRRRR